MFYFMKIILQTRYYDVQQYKHTKMKHKISLTVPKKTLK